MYWFLTYWAMKFRGILGGGMTYIHHHPVLTSYNKHDASAIQKQTTKTIINNNISTDSQSNFIAKSDLSK
jgi:hypothetical protein